MHDIGPTARELGYALHELQPENFEYTGEDEGAGEGQWEAPFQESGFGQETGYESGANEAAYESMEGPYETGFEAGPYESFEAGAYETGGQESPLHESVEMELAAELLEVASEDELDQFLGKLIRRVGSTVGRLVRSPIGRALGGLIKPMLKAALPIAGGAVGTFFGGPLGGMAGSKLAGAAGQLFGLELEGLSAEDRDFEVARRVVKLAATATNNASAAPPNVDPQAAARAALIAAATSLAPGLAAGQFGRFAPRPGARPQAPYYPGGAYGTGRRRGIWVRRGRSIVLHGV
jgi:hypothetical protein